MINKLITSAFVTSALSPALIASQERPNIIYIFTDQQTAQAMSCIGNSDVKTPNMDRLAAAGILFENAYCTAPLSGPTRGAMFTGMFPSETGTTSNGTPLPDSMVTRTLGTFASEAGYECVYAGKWHVHENTIPDGKYGFRQIHPHNDNGLAEACVSYLQSKPNKPFFLVAAFDNPHNICEYARSQNLPYGNIPEADLRDCPGLPTNFAKNPYDATVIDFERRKSFSLYPTVSYTPDDWRKYRYTYYRLVEKVDAEIGKIIDAIDRNGLWKNTLVIFSSDHGDGNGSHQWNQKSALYEEVVNVPLIVTLPQKRHAGKRMPQLINNGVDFFATVCDYIGIQKPDNTSGKSFRPLLESADRQMPHQEYVVCETQFDGGSTRGWMVRTAHFKYVLYDKGLYREQLFDMEKDRGEMRNLAVEHKYQEVLKAHRKLLNQWMKEHHIKQTRSEINDIPGLALKDAAGR